MNPVSFSGINIDIYFYPPTGASPTEHPDQLEGVVFDQKTLKTVSVQFHGPWLDNLGSPGFQLTKKILQDSSGVLEELELEIHQGFQDFITKVVQNITFPSLKILKLRDDYQSDDASYKDHVKVVLSHAPNLKVLHINSSINLLLSILKGSSVMPVYGDRVYAPFEDISDDVISAIKFENMKLVCYGPRFNFRRFTRITPMILEQFCTTTLRSIWLDAELAIPVMSYGIRLENVKSLGMNLDYGRLEFIEPRILRIVQNFDFTRIFPNLKKVTILDFNHLIALPPNHMNRIIEQANAVLRNPLPNRAANVKALKLVQEDLSSEAAQFFGEMFPTIEKLVMATDADADPPTPFESIWKNWPYLKELTVQANMLPTTENLDSVFCGIFPEEVAELKLMDEEYLKRVNIVPVKPALTCLKNLKVLSLNHKDPRYVPFGDDATFLFSKVTALVAFARRPALAVSLKVSSHTDHVVPPAMTHLEHYVAITSDRLEEEELDEA